MQNRKLYCSSTNCAHNINNSCNAGYIHIRGNSAVITSETTCSSYFADSVGFLTSAIQCGRLTSPSDIICEAYNCKYNSNHSCKANDVHINSHYSSCETFKCT